MSQSASLFKENPKNIVSRLLVIHVLPDNLISSRPGKWSGSQKGGRQVACGLVRSVDIEGGARPLDRESIIQNLEKPYRISKIEQNILEGKETWQNVRHPYFGASSELNKAPSNLNFEGVERPDLSVDSLSLESAASTQKGGYSIDHRK